MKRFILFVCLTVISVAGCNRNEMFLTHLEQFVAKIETEYDNLDDGDWLRIDKRFSERIEAWYRDLRNSFSPSDREKALGLIRKYNELKINHEKDLFFRDLKNSIKDAQMQYRNEYNSVDWDYLEKGFETDIEP